MWLLVAFVVIAAAVVVIVSDLKYYLVPNGAVVVLIVVGIGLAVSRSPARSWGMMLYDFGAAVFFALIPFTLWLISRGKWMGLGDAKLFFATSLLAGFPGAFAAFLFSFWLGGLGGIILILSGRKAWGERLPFAPFIIAGSLLALFLGERFLSITGISVLLDLML
jgi:prepilin signal peptidase PulO-like enzyme (type II secretory pathway)